MKKILLIYPPFCTPASPPYTITYLHSFLKNNLSEGYLLDVIDLNLEFHKQEKFSKYKKYYGALTGNYNRDEYDKITEEYKKLTSEIYSRNNKLVVNGASPGYFDELLGMIIERKPDIAAFSIVYSSQSFYAYALIKKLKELGIKTVVGGPAVNSKLKGIANHVLGNEVELLEYITEKKTEHEKLNLQRVLDFNIFDLDLYFIPMPVLPLKTTSTCYYKKCAFCTHYTSSDYYEFDLEDVKKTIIDSKQKNFFIIDDMISKKRILEIADVLKPLNVSWMCQLKPLKEFDNETMKTLYGSGLKIIMWGVESGCNRILSLMRKGTNKEDIAEVLKNSRNAEIKNLAYIMIGFPTETKEEFNETMEFLGQNMENIDVILPSIFGLQKGSYVYNNPCEFGITKIISKERTILDANASYEIISGLTREDARALRRKNIKKIEKMGKFPKTMSFFREHMLCVVKD